MLVPCNNVEFLPECLLSVEQQDYPGVDVLVILNGPARVSIEKLISTYSNYSFPIEFVSTETEGIVQALNLGLRRCTNDLIARIDSDDEMPASRITLQVEQFRKDSNIVCVGGQLEFIGIQPQKKHPIYPLGGDLLKHALYRFSPLPHPGVMFKRSAVVKVGMYREDFPHIEDWDLWVRLSEVGKIINIPETTVYYRLHPNQTTTIHSTAQKNSMKEFSAKTLRETLFGHVLSDNYESFTQEPFTEFQLLKFFLFKRTPSKQSGLFGRKSLRRALAGYLYFRVADSDQSAIRSFLNYLLIIFFDPGLMLWKARMII